MFETWLELDQRPFGTAPFAAHYYASDAIEQARRAVHGCIERGTGPAVVVGAEGTGKTMLALVLQHEVCPLAPFALVTGAELHSRRELLQTLLYEYGLPFRGEQETELRLSLLDFVTSRDASQLASVLVVDDADCLTPELLHDLSSLSNHVRDGNWCLQLVLLGTLRLEELLAAPTLTSLQQRIACRCHLGNWTLPETIDYIYGQVTPLQQRWSRFPSFPEDTCQKIYAITSGNPRLVNQLCEHLLMAVLVTGESVVSPDEAEHAWYDLQQLPAPNHAIARTAADSLQQSSGDALIEFGELTDDVDNLDEKPTPLGTHDIQSKLEELQDGLNEMVAGESPNSHASPSDPPQGTLASDRATNPFAEPFAEEVAVDCGSTYKFVPVRPDPIFLIETIHSDQNGDPPGPSAQRAPGDVVNVAVAKLAERVSDVSPFRPYRRLFSRLGQGA